MFYVILLCIGIGLILVVVFSWVFEMTPEGLKRESEIDRSQSITAQTGKKLNNLIIATLVLALGYFVIDKFMLSPQRESSAIEAALQEAGDKAAAGQASVELTVPAAAEEPDRSIAVLPFVDMSPDKNQEYFSDGLSEELLNLLAKIPELRVAARTSAFSYKGTDVKIDQVGRELGVAHVLEGSVRTAGNRIRVKLRGAVQCAEIRPQPAGSPCAPGSVHPRKQPGHGSGREILPARHGVESQ